MWPDRRILDLFGIELPILQAPMAGSSGPELAIAICEAGGLGSLPCAMLADGKIRADFGIVRQRTSRPLSLNFMCHVQPVAEADREAAWRKRLAPYYSEFGIDADAIPSGPAPITFNESGCAIVEELSPKVVSFHFGLPEQYLLERVKATGAKVIASATTVEEARWLEARGCDAIIAQGAEAGGHRGLFLGSDVLSQPGTFPLVPQVADAVSVPVIAAGGIADGRGIAAAFMLGASAVQIGTAYLRCPESLASAVHKSALAHARDDGTTFTNVFTGRPARAIVNRFMREMGPVGASIPDFPLATPAVMPLGAKAEASGSGDFSPLWAGQSAALGKPLPARELTLKWAADATQLMGLQAADRLG
jgi:nitronate monooxygenase